LDVVAVHPNRRRAEEPGTLGVLRRFDEHALNVAFDPKFLSHPTHELFGGVNVRAAGVEEHLYPG
jgi:hypothetical protein